MSEINAEETLNRLKEDALARDHQGYFKLWSMTLSRGRDGNWGHLPWIKDKLLGTFASREPCERFLDLIHHGPWATYTFHRFSHDIDEIKGYWKVEVDKNGNLKEETKRINFLMPKFEFDSWKWKKEGIDGEHKSDWNNGSTFNGVARTRERAHELALEAKADFEKFVAEERPKRAEGCYCGPFRKEVCGPCEKAEQKRKKKDCGCPHCEGDH